MPLYQIMIEAFGEPATFAGYVLLDFLVILIGFGLILFVFLLFYEIFRLLTK